MKRKIISTVLLLGLVQAKAQFTTYATFEDLSLPVDSFENGRNLNGSFINGNILFLNQYTDWGGGI